MLDENALVRVIADEAPGRASIAWAASMSFQIPQIALRKLGISEFLQSNGRLSIPGSFPVDATSEHALDLRLRRAFTDQAPVSSRLPFSYRNVPGWLRSRLATAVGKWKRRSVQSWASFPSWPLDLSADFLADLSTSAGSPLSSGPTPVLLSHDLDSAEGLQNLATRFLDLEENVGARSINYIVPCAWQLDLGLLDEVCSRGHCIGIHGHDHSNRTPFVSPAERKIRLEAARPLIERYGIKGYRAPSLLRTKALLESLGEYYEHDSSIPTSGGLFPIPNNGCASARPFRIDGLIEIPLSMPRDGSLRFLGYRPREILELWIDCAARISRSGGVVVLLTHCESRFSGNPEMLSVYREFMEHISESDRYAWSSADEICSKFAEFESASNS